MYVLGIDTSNYTTSLCAVSMVTGELAAESRQVLPVPAGQKGLRQSEALFLHVQQIPTVFAELCRQLPRTPSGVLWSGLAASVRPRPCAASYMPVFNAGQSFMTTLGLALGLPVVRTSHQEGHLAAAEYFINREEESIGTHFAVHLSGGTSDVLLARREKTGYHVTRLGEALDLHAGQYVDRIGVRLGLPFPAGPALEQLAETCGGSDFQLPSRAIGAQMSFSGPCAAALRALDEGVEPAQVAFAVEQSIANSVVKALQWARGQYPEVHEAIVAGGVAANRHIRSRIESRMRVLQPTLTVNFAPARYSSDNALGVATIGWRFLRT